MNDYQHSVLNVMDLVNNIKAFVATVETGSFTAAAERMRISNRLTSKYVADLESTLGVRLLQRTTRKIGLTPEGEKLFARAPRWLDELQDMLDDVSDTSRGLSGVIRVSAPLTFGELFVVKVLQSFADHHPDLTFDLRLSDTYADLASEGIDVAFRIGKGPATSVITRKLGEMSSYLVASPDYLETNGEIGSVADLAKRDCIYDSNRRGGEQWELHGQDGIVRVPVKRTFIANSAKVVRDLCIAGEGVGFCPDFVIADDLRAGRLKRVLPEFQGPKTDVAIVYLEGWNLPRKVRALIDFVVASRKGDAGFLGMTR